MREQPRMVVLASCQSAGDGDEWTSTDEGALSALGRRLAEIGVPAVVAMQGNVSMETVKQFMPVFFKELQADGQIDRAMAVARRDVWDRPDWWVPVLFTRLEGGQLFVPTPAGEKSVERIPWSTVREACKAVSKREHRFVGEGLNPELYLHRAKIHTHFGRFLESQDKYYLTLVGKSGMGKSTFLWGLVKQLQGPKHAETACLFCDVGMDLESKDSILEVLTTRLAHQLKIAPQDTFLAIRPSKEHPERRLVLIVDALNEFPRMQNMEMLLREFRDLVERFPWLRLVISCRPHYWEQVDDCRKRLKIDARSFYRDSDDRPEPFVWLGKLDNEEVALMYEMHQQVYDFQPQRFGDLEQELQRRLRDPLSLWLCSEICRKRNVSEQKNVLLIDVKAIPAFVKVLQKRGRLSRDGSDLWFLREVLPKLFIKARVDHTTLRGTTMDENDLVRAQHAAPLRRQMIYKEGTCLNYTSRSEILGLGIGDNAKDRFDELVKAGLLKGEDAQRLSIALEGRTDLQHILTNLVECGILKEHGQGRLSFSFERYYGFYMGLFLKRIANEGIALNCQEELPNVS
jgi:hypothetical protein